MDVFYSSRKILFLQVPLCQMRMSKEYTAEISQIEPYDTAIKPKKKKKLMQIEYQAWVKVLEALIGIGRSVMELETTLSSV